ncbi:oxidoreductase [Nocardia flavorosea]|uniref:oxidoreductase n=1 Tax=Nocardia flavorosea TaxID=53429 RepID=UPI00245600C4|nr:oxidoreductase [Nocardia flavorosea]
MPQPTSRPGWDPAEIPDLGGRTAVVTGANSGIGFETARILAEHGARVVLACRNLESASNAADRIRVVSPGAELECVHLDLMSLQSVRIAAEVLRSRNPRIDLLVNNAGAATRRYIRTPDGFEATLATNHLGPFALTGLLLDRLAPVPGARIVTVSSVTHRRTRLPFEDLHAERRRYRYMEAYGQSKLANLLFTFELQRRLTGLHAEAIAVAAHPGSARSQFSNNMGLLTRILTRMPWYLLVSWSQQPAAQGALSTIRAAVGENVRGGEFYGPTRLFGFKGRPELTRAAAHAYDEAAQARLWTESERLTGVEYPHALAVGEMVRDVGRNPGRP